MNNDEIENWLAFEAFAKRVFQLLLIASITIAPFVILWAFSDSLPFQDEITVYKMFCTQGRKDGKCNSIEQIANPTTYKASVEQQLVIKWTGNSAPIRYDKCAVRNARNWTCIFSDQPDLLSDVRDEMVDGQFRHISSSIWNVPSPFYDVPKWYWWWIKLNS